MTPGNVVIIQAGNYDERIRVNISGWPGAPITFQANGNVVVRGFTVQASYITIKGFEITNVPGENWEDSFGIYVDNAGYCILEGNYIHYALYGGISLSKSTDNCVLANNRLYRNALVGMEISGINHLIENNEVWGTIQYHPDWSSAPDWADADGITFFGSGHIFRGNYIHDISLDDPQNKDPHIDAFQTYDFETDDVTRSGAGKDCIFERNKINLPGDNNKAAGFQIEGGVNNLTIRNNIIDTFSGFIIYKNRPAPYTVPNNIYILNNLIIGDLSYNPEQFPEGISISDLDNNLVVVMNNIFAEQRGQTIWIVNSPGIETNYNLFYNSDGSIPDGIQQIHDLWGLDPLFADPTASKYYLLFGSPAIDAGTTLSSVIDDYDGNPRPKGAGYDIGPYEHQSTQ